MSNYHPTLVYHWFLRVVHWAIAGAVALLLPLGILIAVADDLKVPEANADVVVGIHAAIGFFFASAILIRVILLFAWGDTSGWRDVAPHTRAQFNIARDTIKYYLKGFRGGPPLYYGHNPFAGIVYTAFFFFALTQAASGITMVVVHLLTEGGGNKAAKAYADAAFIAHDVGALFVIFYVFAHLGALALHDIVERRGLASSMISGCKFFNDEELKELEARKGRGR
ncbi:MAG: cytochrome b/b6 domain-containing protein [Deltaproteobacteria bacterium]|nr:cytochrome b/b6 domain-containing protein [Deltaproteobacteria bacterium]